MQRTTWTAALLLDAVILPTHLATVVARSADILSDLHLEGTNAPGQVVCSSVAMVTSEVLTQPAPQRRHRHQVETVAGHYGKLHASCSRMSDTRETYACAAWAWFKARLHGEAGLALPGRMMAPSCFQRWCEYGSRCWRSSEAARE